MPTRSIRPSARRNILDPSASAMALMREAVAGLANPSESGSRDGLRREAGSRSSPTAVPIPIYYDEWSTLVRDSPDVPEMRTRPELMAMSDSDRHQYNRRRRIWHANMGTLPTPQLTAVTEALHDIVDSNQQTGDKVRGPVAIVGPPGHGKTTIANSFLAEYQDQELRIGSMVDPEHARIPIVRISLQESSNSRDVGVKLCEFLRLPSTGTSIELHLRALDAIARCHTKVIFIDELQFLSMDGPAGRRMQNYFKFLANEFPVTLVFAGHGIREMNSIVEGGNRDAAREQSLSRWTYLDVGPFRIDTEEGRLEWWKLLLNVEHRLRLADKTPTMLSRTFADYFYARTEGRIQSVFTLVNRAAGRAIRTGVETFTRDLLDSIKLEELVERDKEARLIALDEGLFQSRPSRATISAAKARSRKAPDVASTPSNASS